MSSAQSPTFPSLHLRHNSFSNPSIALPTSKLILQPFRCFTYVTTRSPTFPSLHLRHNSFSNTSVALPTSQFILQRFFRFSYVTCSLLNSPGEPPMSVIKATNRSIKWKLLFFANTTVTVAQMPVYVAHWYRAREWAQRVAGSNPGQISTIPSTLKYNYHPTDLQIQYFMCLKSQYGPCS